ncbi:serpin family protein [Nocardiopsis protaetiae]|uniref:serpin family protein n=2 Tax=Nocardiopsis protaetiae TaxID=3382270 RepID=UPI00387B4B34
MTPELDPDHLRFALSLEDSLAEPDTSHVWSPHSAATALSLLAAGASGEVLAALTRLLAADRGTLDEHVTALDAAVSADAGGAALGGTSGWAPPGGQEAPPLELASVNDLYVRADRTVLPGFAAELAGRPASAVRPVDFAADPEKVRREINAAVAEVTRGMIPDLLSPGAVTAGTESVLLNALWVRLVWASPFDSERTEERVFHAPGGDRPVPTMRQTDHFQVAGAAGLRMLTLAGHHGLYLDVVLPEEGTEPPVLTAGAHRALLGSLRSERVDVALPRFRVESGFELLPLLPGLAAAAGGPSDDLRGITGDPLQVDAIIHRAVLNVDEVGAEGAAATAVMMTLGSAMPPPRPLEFHVDRPFAFVLRRGSAALFLGRVTDPRDPGPAQPLEHSW